MAGSGRARRFRQARELKQGRRPEVCSFCRANLGLGEAHDPGCDYASAYEDPYAEDSDDDEENEDDQEAEDNGQSR